MIKDFTLYKESKKHLTLFKAIISMPIIYGFIPILIIFDVLLEIYHQICFRLYKIPLVKRSDYIFIDRHKVQSLSLLQKFNCIYCGYGNGLIAYAREIIKRTEMYWCPMKHENYDKVVKVQPQQKDYFDRK